MVGTKGKSGRHKKDCCCNGCTERKAKRMAMQNAGISEAAKQDTAIGQ